MKRKIYLFFLLITALVLSLNSCTKDGDASLSGATTDPTSSNNPIGSNNSGNNGSGANNGFKPMLQIRMHDAPASYDSVVVDVQEVRIKMGEDSLGTDSGWITLATNVGLYDLLSFQNGLDTLIAASPVPADTVTMVSLVLGTNNYVVEGGVSHPLTIPSGSESGLKVNLSRVLNATLETISIDFDAAASIRKTGNGKYIMRPVLIVQ